MSWRMVSPLRRTFIILAAALALLACGHTTLWLVAISQLEDGVSVWQAQRRAAGWTVEAAPAGRSGWPWAVRLDLPSLALAGGAADIPGGMSWRGEQVGLGIALLRPRRLVVTVGGPQVLRVGTLAEVPFTAARFVVGVPLDGDVPAPTADLAAEGLDVRTPFGDATVTRLAGRGAWQPGGMTGGELSFDAGAEAIDLPPAAGALGPRIEAAALDGVLTGFGAMPRVTVPAARAAAWRDGGGRLEVRRLRLAWGPLGLSGRATLSLDARLQPAGEAEARIVGAAETVDALAAARTLPPRTAQAIRGVVALLARAPGRGAASDGAPEIELPLTLRERILSVGGFPVLRMPELVWQAGP